MIRCEQCGKELKNDFALKIHTGRMHGSKAKAAKAASAKATTAKAANTCAICGRSFGMPAHLARHMSASHKRTGKAAPARRVKRRYVARAAATPSAAAGIQVAALTIDQLVDLKNAVDARLAAIAQQLRKAKIGV